MICEFVLYLFGLVSWVFYLNFFYLNLFIPWYTSVSYTCLVWFPVILQCMSHSLKFRSSEKNQRILTLLLLWNFNRRQQPRYRWHRHRRETGREKKRFSLLVLLWLNKHLPSKGLYWQREHKLCHLIATNHFFRCRTCPPRSDQSIAQAVWLLANGSDI